MSRPAEPFHRPSWKPLPAWTLALKQASFAIHNAVAASWAIEREGATRHFWAGAKDLCLRAQAVHAYQFLTVERPRLHPDAWSARTRELLVCEVENSCRLDSFKLFEYLCMWQVFKEEGIKFRLQVFNRQQGCEDIALKRLHAHCFQNEALPFTRAERDAARHRVWHRLHSIT